MHSVVSAINVFCYLAPRQPVSLFLIMSLRTYSVSNFRFGRRDTRVSLRARDYRKTNLRRFFVRLFDV